jgi:signal transduction histidine kinase
MQWAEFCRKAQPSVYTYPHVHFVEGGHVREMSSPVKRALHYMVTELITNALKYAEAQHIDVVLSWEKDKLICEVSDDGKGLKTHYQNTIKHKSRGLSTMKPRAFELGGTFVIEPNERGCRFVISIPLSQ